jgi:hypothetical protein
MARPKFEPTADQRQQVKSLVALGILHEDIAKFIGIKSPKTLRKHFRKELDLGVIAANAKVGQTLFQLATSGKCVAATIYYLKVRAHWSERAGHQGPPVSLPDLVITEDAWGPKCSN